MEQKVLRTGAMAIACALTLRLLGGIAGDLTAWQKLSSAMVFLQTGRVMRPSNVIFTPAGAEEPTDEPTHEATEETTESTASSEPLPGPAPDLPVFSPADVDSIDIKCGFSYSADLSELLCKPLEWNLSDGQPAVLIYHSHATESFSATTDYKETSDYHTLDATQNMLCIGKRLTTLLEEQGIRVIHDTALHDTPSYSGAYTSSRKSVQEYLETYPSIRLVLDLHRDAYEDKNGNQVAQTVFSDGARLAPLMFVVGTDYGSDHPQWRENLSLALKLQTLLDQACPGICRNINLRSQKFNQDLSPGALLVEVGAAGNTREQALAAVEVLADGIIKLSRGSL